MPPYLWEFSEFTLPLRQCPRSSTCRPDDHSCRRSSEGYLHALRVCGYGFFSVNAVSATSSKQDWLVASIGAYDGTVVWNQRQSFFVVEADGEWTVDWPEAKKGSSEEQTVSATSSTNETDGSDTAASQPSEATSAGESSATVGQKNAARKAQPYLKLMAFSRDSLIDQLLFEGFTDEEAVYGADSCGADWNQQAVLKAQSCLDFMAFSRDSLIDQLLYEGFTYEQTEYGVAVVGL